MMPLCWLYRYSDYGNIRSDSGLTSYLNIAQLAMDTGPILGGIALAAVLAAVISSGAPILLASATMFVNDWIPAAKAYDSDRVLRAYKIVTVLYGTAAAVIAWLGNISSVLQLVLWGLLWLCPGFAVGYVFYWRRKSRAYSGVWRPGLQAGWRCGCSTHRRWGGKCTAGGLRRHGMN